jgi:peptidyl-prolyl cis-trans isomerase C
MTIRVNGREIAPAAVLAEMQYHPAPSRAAAERAAAEALVVRELLLQAAAARGLAQGGAAEDEAATEAVIARLLEQDIQTPELEEEPCRRYYESNRRKFRTPDICEAQHILIAAAPEDAEARAAAAAKAKELIAELQRNGDRFAELARRHSDCPSREQEGRLGQVTRGSTVPEFETFLFSLEEGELCPVPVASRYGLHVVRLLRRERGRDLPFDAVRERIGETLADHAWRMAVAQYLKILAGQARIEGIEIERALSPLVQ